MTEIWMPSDLPVARQSPSLMANTTGFASPTVGTVRTYERLGDRYQLRLDMVAMKNQAATFNRRARLESILTGLRGQANRLRLTVPSYTRRGSFPSTELFSNNTFSNGLTGWSFYGSWLTGATVYDRTLRLRRDGRAVEGDLQQTPTLVQYAPYVGRMFLSGKSNVADAVAMFFNAGGNQGGSSALYAPGYLTIAMVTTITGGYAYPYTAVLPGTTAGDYLDIPWLSMARCALIDNGANGLTYSEQFDHSNWGKVGLTVTANGGTAPDGTSTADILVEDGSTGGHYLAQGVTVTSGVSEWTFEVFLAKATRTWAWVQMTEATGATDTYIYVNLATGAVGATPVTGGNWANLRYKVVDYGNTWYRVTITATKTNAATTINAYVGTATGDGVGSYAGTNALTAIYAWGASFRYSSCSRSYVASKTTSAPIGSGVPQTGTKLRLCGLPVSTVGLLLPGDWIECNGQLNQVTASLDSDAAGLGVVSLARPFANSPADVAPFIVTEPLGKFMLAQNSAGWSERPGVITEASLDLIEDIVQ